MEIKGKNFPHKDLFVSLFNEDVYLVGGAVRDFLISGAVDNRKDVDLMVVGFEYSELEEILKDHGRINTVGKSFAVIKFTKNKVTYDISVPRRDKKKDAGSSAHRNFIVESGKGVTLEEDLGRRDFTCNSIAMRLSDGKLFDPFNGMDAINRKLIVMTGPESFADDPLRLLRAARFSSVLGFEIEEEIYKTAKNVDLSDLSSERITEELFRLLLESGAPSKGLLEYFRLTILEKLYPDIYKMALTIQDSEFHPEKDEFGHHTVFIHMLITLDIGKKISEIKGLNTEEELAFLLSVILHDIGKPVTTKWEHKRGRMTVTSIRHDSVGVGLADSLFDELKIDTRMKFPLKDVVLKLIKNHHRVYDLFSNREDIGFKAFSRLLRDMDGRDDLLIFLDFADRQSREQEPLNFIDYDDISKWYYKRKEELKITRETIDPIIQGRDLIRLGVSPGVEMGDYLKKLYELQLDGVFSSFEDGISQFKIIREDN
ncbi:MAG: HD domain-containing protein [Acidobacteriota bacterium]